MLPAHLLIKPRAGFALSGWLWDSLQPEWLQCSLMSRNAIQQCREQGEPVPPSPAPTTTHQFNFHPLQFEPRLKPVSHHVHERGDVHLPSGEVCPYVTREQWRSDIYERCFYVGQGNEAEQSREQ